MMLLEHPLPHWFPILLVAIIPLLWMITKPDPDLPPIINAVKTIPSVLWMLVCLAAYLIA